MCVCVCVCVCACACALVFLTFSSTDIDIDIDRTSTLHGDQSLVFISEVLVKVSDKMWIVVRLRLGIGFGCPQ